jgi:hypothetical protein
MKAKGSRGKAVRLNYSKGESEKVKGCDQNALGKVSFQKSRGTSEASFVGGAFL